ncbi:MAG TPA: hypothetical protein VG078_04850 [Acidimicrobiales bacterium]|nr:hypothetical protein [Acidimicrobiales bacterium]
MRPRAALRALLFFSVAALLASTAGVLPAAAQQPSAQAVPGMRYLTDVWCGPDGTCLGVGFTPDNVGAVVVLRAVGPSGPVRPVPGTGELNQIDCAPGGSCVAVGVAGGRGAVVEVSRDGSPGPVRAVPASTNLWDVTCPTATTCIATGSLSVPIPTFPYLSDTPLFVVIDNGQPAPAQEFPRGTRRAIGIDCPTATTCLAVGSTGFVVLTNINGTWTVSLRRHESAPGAYPTYEISCPTSTTCYATAAGFAIMAVSADGVAGPVQVLSSGTAEDISCPFGRTCTVVGQNNFTSQGLVVDVFRGTVAASTTYANSNWFSGVSCIGVASCGVVGTMPTYAVFAWHGPVPA